MSTDTVGNMAKMREALEIARKAILDVRQFMADGSREDNIMKNAHKAILDALAAPPRNCDKFPDENDAREAFKDMCIAGSGGMGWKCHSCRFKQDEYVWPCSTRWLLAQFAEIFRVEEQIDGIDYNKPKACPVCKTDLHLKVEKGHSDASTNMAARVKCSSCGLTGPQTEKDLGAVWDWNIMVENMEIAETQQKLERELGREADSEPVKAPFWRRLFGTKAHGEGGQQ